jgi:hypothetical protein
MMTHNKATFGIYRNKEQVDVAVTLLSGLGFSDAPASILFPDKEGAQDFPQVQKSELVKFAKIGSLIGGVLFLIFSILAVAGILPFAPLDNAPAAASIFAIVGSVFLGSIIGAACGTLVGIGTPDRAGRRYGQYVNAGGILLSVHSETPEQQHKIEEALERSGAQDITSVDETRAWEDVLNEKGNLERLKMSRGEAESAQPVRSIEESVVQQQTHA